MGQKTKKIVFIVLAIYIILQTLFFVFYFSYYKPMKIKQALEEAKKKQESIVKRPVVEYETATNDNTDANSTEEKLTVITQGQLQLLQRKASTLEATLASRIPINDKLIRFVSGDTAQEVDTSLFEKVMIGNTTYEFKLAAYKGTFLDSATTSYLLQLQIPAQGEMKSTFKWFLFDTNLQLVCKLNLKDKGLDLPGKIFDPKDYDNDGRSEILLETTKYLNPDNFSSPRYLFKVLNERQLVLVWREESVNNDRDTGKCSSVTKITYDQNNPPPPNNPELISIKKVYASTLSAGFEEEKTTPNYNYSALNANNNIPVISNKVTYEEILEYPDRQEICNKVLDTYVYTWDLNKMEFVYTKKESKNLDVNID
ncbi:MAG: hypothetical protein ACM3UU_00675 [Ignavibacteriales bacterium]